MKQPTKSFRLLLVAVIGALAFSSCHTVKGVGEDVETAGDRVQRAAR